MSAKVKPAAQARQRLAELADEFRNRVGGVFVDAAAREWTALPKHWRMALLLIAGVGDEQAELPELAARSWRELPPHEREALRFACRDGKRCLGGLTALVARV